MRAHHPVPSLVPPRQPQVLVRVILLIVVVAAVVVLAVAGYGIDAAVAAVVLCGSVTAELAVRLGIPAPEQPCR